MFVSLSPHSQSALGDTFQSYCLGCLIYLHFSPFSFGAEMCVPAWSKTSCLGPHAPLHLKHPQRWAWGDAAPHNCVDWPSPVITCQSAEEGKVGRGAAASHKHVGRLPGPGGMDRLVLPRDHIFS